MHIDQLSGQRGARQDSEREGREQDLTGAQQYFPSTTNELVAGVRAKATLATQPELTKIVPTKAQALNDNFLLQPSCLA